MNKLKSGQVQRLTVEGISIYLSVGQKDDFDAAPQQKTTPDPSYCLEILSNRFQHHSQKKVCLPQLLEPRVSKVQSADRNTDSVAMSKQPPTKTSKGSNSDRPDPPSQARRNSASSMYANPDEDPNYQRDPVIGRDMNASERNDQTDSHIIDGPSKQSTQPGK